MSNKKKRSKATETIMAVLFDFWNVSFRENPSVNSIQVGEPYVYRKLVEIYLSDYPCRHHQEESQIHNHRCCAA